MWRKRSIHWYGRLENIRRPTAATRRARRTLRDVVWYYSKPHTHTHTHTASFMALVLLLPHAAPPLSLWRLPSQLQSRQGSRRNPSLQPSQFLLTARCHMFSSNVQFVLMTKLLDALVFSWMFFFLGYICENLIFESVVEGFLFREPVRSCLYRKFSFSNYV